MPVKVGVYTGCLVALSSTAIVLKMLSDRGETGSPTGQEAVAFLIERGADMAKRDDYSYGTRAVGVPGRFAAESLLVLNLLIIGSAVIATVVTARNTFIRKHDLRTRFELENARSDMELLSMQDHLTGAWNRRFLSENFMEFAESCVKQGNALHVAILDIDNFKGINDEFGHQFGDGGLDHLIVADGLAELHAPAFEIKKSSADGTSQFIDQP